MDKNILLRKNIISSILTQIVTMLYGFVLPKIYLNYYGSDANGLVNSIAQFLSFISLMELGIGAVIQASLYKPISDGDIVEISKIVKSADRFFKKIAYIFLVYVVVLLFIYPKLISGFDYIYVDSMILIISISLFSQYYFGLVNQLLLTADQRVYVVNYLSLFSMLSTVAATLVAVMIFKVGIHEAKFISAIFLLIRPICLNVYVNKKYGIDKKIEFNGEPIKQKWNGLSQHISAVVMGNTDSIILTVFSTLMNVSIYSVYNMVVVGVLDLVKSMLNSFQALLGDFLARKDYVKANQLFSQFEWIVTSVITVLFTITALMIVPFVMLYTKGVNDADYNQPLFGALVTIAQALIGIRMIYFCAIKAAGRFKETQNAAIIEVIINLCISIVFVIRFELIGVAIGTLIAVIYRVGYCIFYSSVHIFNRSIWIPIKQMLVNIMIAITSVIINLFFGIVAVSVGDWMICAVRVSMVCICVYVIYSLVFYRNNLNMLVKRQLLKF